MDMTQAARNSDELEQDAPVPAGEVWAAKARARARELAVDIDHGYMELAEILYLVKDTADEDDNPAKLPLYKSWGFKTFEDYVNAELGFSVRKAQRLRYIYFKLEVELAGLDEALKKRIKALGWSKVRELALILTLENAEEWTKLAEENSFRDLEKLIQQAKAKKIAAADSVKDGEEKEVAPVADTLTKKTFMLYPDQLVTVDEALERAAQLCDRDEADKPGHFLELVCADFLATNGFLDGGVDEKLRFLAKVEAKFGLHIVVTDSMSKKVLYGMDTLSRLADAAGAAAGTPEEAEASPENPGDVIF
jgi:hypothetical protein